MKVFVAGGTGFVGSYVVGRLIDAGHSAVCLARSPENSRLPDTAALLQGDALDDGSRLAGKMAGCDAVINLIGIIREFPSRGVTFKKVHVEATRNLVDGAKRAGITRFIQMSANGSRPDGITGYQRSKFEAEEYVRNSGMEWTVFRPSLIFGRPPEGRTEFCSQIAGMVRFAPFMPVFGNGSYLFQPVHAQDVADCFADAPENAEAKNRTFHLGGKETLSYRAILDMICIALGRSPVYKVNVPWALAKPFISVLGRMPFFPATAEQIEMLMEGNTVPESDYTEVFGINPKEFSSETLSYLSKR